MWSLFAQRDSRKNLSFLYCHRPFTARMHYKHHSLDLLTGRKGRGGAKTFLKELRQIPLNATFKQPKVMHLSYELGHFFTGADELVPGHLPLAIEIEYLNAERVQLDELWAGPVESPRLRFLQVPSLAAYRQSFRRTREELLAGNCYQVNLTAPFYLAWERHHRPSDFIRTLWKDPARVGAYAHTTWLSTMGKLLLSNSPECLVQRQGSDLYSMPIKGTTPDRPGAWEHMSTSRKELGELNMITDLVRNDLSRVNQPVARVVARQLPLKVPGLLHQYSLVAAKVPQDVCWGRVLECLFPGGSVTGAPKKRVMNLLHQLESEPRGMYCGSTWLAHRETLAASINIRTAELDMSARELKYGAGGGITLLSEEDSEFEEMMRKSESFLSPFLT
jgi:para-aminobenzoate synthetase component 1